MHFEPKSGYQPDWKPSVKPCHTKDDARPDPPRGLKKIPQNNNKEPTKDRPEKKHSEAGRQTDATNDEEIRGKACFVGLDNRKSVNEYSTEQRMGTKKRVNTMYEARNGCPMTSLGDKIYKDPTYMTQFFKDGGLVAGSTNKARNGSQGNGKAIDFYAGLSLDKGPLNPGMKTYVQVCKE